MYQPPLLQSTVALWPLPCARGLAQQVLAAVQQQPSFSEAPGYPGYPSGFTMSRSHGYQAAHSSPTVSCAASCLPLLPEGSTSHCLNGFQRVAVKLPHSSCRYSQAAPTNTTPLSSATLHLPPNLSKSHPLLLTKRQLAPHFWPGCIKQSRAFGTPGCTISKNPCPRLYQQDFNNRSAAMHLKPTTCCAHHTKKQNASHHAAYHPRRVASYSTVTSPRIGTGLCSHRPTGAFARSGWNDSATTLSAVACSAGIHAAAVHTGGTDAEQAADTLSNPVCQQFTSVQLGVGADPSYEDDSSNEDDYLYEGDNSYEEDDDSDQDDSLYVDHSLYDNDKVSELQQFLDDTGVEFHYAFTNARQVYAACLKSGTPTDHLSADNWARWVTWLNTKHTLVLQLLAKDPSFLILECNEARQQQIDETLQTACRLMQFEKSDIGWMLEAQPRLLHVTSASVGATARYLLDEIGMDRYSALGLLGCSREDLEAKVDWLVQQGVPIDDIRIMAPSFICSLKRLQNSFLLLSNFVKSVVTATAIFKTRPGLLTKNLRGWPMQAKLKYWEEALRQYHDRPVYIADVLAHNLIRKTCPRFAMMRALGIPVPEHMESWLSISRRDFMDYCAAQVHGSDTSRQQAVTYALKQESSLPDAPANNCKLDTETIMATHGDDESVYMRFMELLLCINTYDPDLQTDARKSPHDDNDGIPYMHKALFMHPDYFDTAQRLAKKRFYPMNAEFGTRFASDVMYPMWVCVWQRSSEGERWRKLSGRLLADSCHAFFDSDADD